MPFEISDDLRRRAEQLNRERASRKRTSIANPDFVDRMTSSVADPEAAQNEPADQTLAGKRPEGKTP